MNTKQIVISITFGFLGAFLFSMLREAMIPPAEAKPHQILTGSSFNLVDNHGKLRAQLALAKEGAPGLWFFDERGVARGIFGLYADGTSYLGLQDAQGQMIELMRSFGPKETPLLIFKHKGQDMMITGLNPGSDPLPFLMTYDFSRQKKIHFGKYDGP